MSYEWANTLYQTRAAMLDAIAHTWITAWGQNSREEVLQVFNEMTDDDLAAEVLEVWGLDQPQGRRFSLDDERPSHMAEHDYTKEDLAEAFARVRAWHEQHASESD